MVVNITPLSTRLLVATQLRCTTAFFFVATKKATQRNTPPSMLDSAALRPCAAGERKPARAGRVVRSVHRAWFCFSFRSTCSHKKRQTTFAEVLMVSVTNDSRSRGACESNTKEAMRATSACTAQTANRQTREHEKERNKQTNNGGVKARGGGSTKPRAHRSQNIPDDHVRRGLRWYIRRRAGYRKQDVSQAITPTEPYAVLRPPPWERFFLARLKEIHVQTSKEY